ncbi:MAG: hypothetical protein WEA29_05700 [Acidimicrobiia bacterium]
MFALLIGIMGLAAIGRGSAPLVLLHDPEHPDLPCPWCRHQTHEDDTACVGCGRRFG